LSRSKRGQFRRYWRVSRSPLHSWFFLAPLLIGYELFSAFLGDSFGSVRNGVELVFKRPFLALGINGGVGIVSVFVVGLVLLAWAVRRRGGDRLRWRWFLWMFLESVVYALVIGIVVGRATQTFVQIAGPLAESHLGSRFALALGAGAYEEVLFRAFFLGGMLWVLKKPLALPSTTAVVAALLLSAVLFSAAHYIGAAGDSFTMASFLFRVFAGVAFGVVYVLRGVGIAAYSHSLYNVFLILHG